jgi:hypothetical protein
MRQMVPGGDVRERKVVVLAFLGVECPLVNEYAPRRSLPKFYRAAVHSNILRVVV